MKEKILYNIVDQLKDDYLQDIEIELINSFDCIEYKCFMDDKRGFFISRTYNEDEIEYKFQSLDEIDEGCNSITKEQAINILKEYLDY